MSEEMTQEDLAKLAQQRWAKARRRQAMKAGIEVKGCRVVPNEKTKARLAAASEQARINSGAEFDWKFSCGNWQLLSAQGVLELLEELSIFTEQCFSREREVMQAIDAGEFDDSMLQDGWPA